MCNELISESTGPISTVKKAYESLRTSYMHYGTFYGQAPLGGQTTTGPNIYSDYWTNFRDSKVIWNDARWLGHFL